MMNRKDGFTLIELLVVIAIISVLAGLVFSVGQSMARKSQIKATQGTILALLASCEQYRGVYYLYPDLDVPPTGYTGNTTKLSSAATFTEANFLEYNRRLLFMLEEKVYAIGEMRYGPFVTQSLPKIKANDPYTSTQKEHFADAWGNALYVCPGRDHSGDTPKGPKNYLSTVVRSTYLPDILSIGPNEAMEVGNSSTVTAFDTTADGVDDVVGWLTSTKHSEENRK